MQKKSVIEQGRKFCTSVRYGRLLMADLLPYRSYQHDVEIANGKTYDNPIWTALEAIDFDIDQAWTTTDNLRMRMNIEKELAQMRKQMNITVIMEIM